MFLTDATYLYLKILEEILSEGKNYSDGRLFRLKARNRDFSGTTRESILPDHYENRIRKLLTFTFMQLHILLV